MQRGKFDNEKLIDLERQGRGNSTEAQRLRDDIASGASAVSDTGVLVGGAVNLIASTGLLRLLVTIFILIALITNFAFIAFAISLGIYSAIQIQGFIHRRPAISMLVLTGVVSSILPFKLVDFDEKVQQIGIFRTWFPNLNDAASNDLMVAGFFGFCLVGACLRSINVKMIILQIAHFGYRLGGIDQPLLRKRAFIIFAAGLPSLLTSAYIARHDVLLNSTNSLPYGFIFFASGIALFFAIARNYSATAHRNHLQREFENQGWPTFFEKDVSR